MRTHYSPVADNPCESRVVYMEELSRERIEQIYNGEGLHQQPMRLEHFQEWL
jgi:hypothetical protein